MTEQRKPAHAERRASERQLCALETSCFPATGAQNTWPARVIDISTTGVGLLLERRFEPGALLSFRLEGRSEGQSYNALARVVRVTRQAAGHWLLGCAFLDELDPTRVRAFRAAPHVLAESTAEALRRELTRGRAKPTTDG
jgi:hypothetical protein